MLNKLIKLTFLVLFLPSLVFALPSDKNKPATISANSADYNQKTGISVFIGNVIITQGSTKITAEKLITYDGPKQQLSKAFAFGSKSKPAVYQTIPKKGQAIFKASADKIEYLPQKNQVLLIGNGQLQQRHNSLHSDYIIYNQKTGELQTKLVGKSRTTIILEPEKK